MKSVKVTLNDDLEDRLNVLKKRTGIQNYADVVRHLITEAVSPQELSAERMARGYRKGKAESVEVLAS